MFLIRYSFSPTDLTRSLTFCVLYFKPPSVASDSNVSNQYTTLSTNNTQQILNMGSGKLTVKVVNGRGLQNKDTFSKSDPYCMVELGGKSFSTKHMSDNLDPDWNEQFEFDVSQGQDVLALSVWDKNKISKDVFMGYSFVSFDNCKKDQATTKVISLDDLMIMTTDLLI